MTRKKLTPEDNERIEKECLESIATGEEKRNIEVSKSLSHLLGVVEAETIDVEFESSAGNAILKIRANPPQKIMHDIKRISDASVDGKATEVDAKRMSEIMEYLTVDPVIPFELWESGEVPEEIAVKIIMALGVNAVTKQEEREEELKKFRKK